MATKEIDYEIKDEKLIFNIGKYEFTNPVSNDVYVNNIKSKTLVLKKKDGSSKRLVDGVLDSIEVKASEPDVNFGGTFNFTMDVKFKTKNGIISFNTKTNSVLNEKIFSDISEKYPYLFYVDYSSDKPYAIYMNLLVAIYRAIYYFICNDEELLAFVSPKANANETPKVDNNLGEEDEL